MTNIYDSWLTKIPVAHRGLHDDVSPENSLSAYKKAIEKGYAIEIDVHPLKDGNIIVFHDNTLDRMTNLTGNIEDKTLEELKDIKLKGSNEKIPTFVEVLELVSGKVPLLIEIKNEGGVGFEKDVWEILKNYKGEYAIQSFNPFSLKWFKDNAPDVLRGQLSCYFKGEKLNCVKKFILKRMWLNSMISKPHFISYNHEDCPNKYVDRYKNKKPIIVWCVRNKKDQNRIQNYSDNIIFEDYLPER